MSLKTGEHATLTSKAQVEAVLRDNFTGVPDDWVPAIAEQVLQEQASPAGEQLGRAVCGCLWTPNGGVR
jgi:hypothetical protein